VGIEKAKGKGMEEGEGFVTKRKRHVLGESDRQAFLEERKEGCPKVQRNEEQGVPQEGDEVPWKDGLINGFPDEVRPRKRAYCPGGNTKNNEDDPEFLGSQVLPELPERFPEILRSLQGFGNVSWSSPQHGEGWFRHG